MARLSAPVCAALDTLIQTSTLVADDGDMEQAALFPVRSELATLKEDAGAVKVETVLEEIEKLKQLRNLGLPEDLFGDVPAKLVTAYRQRAVSEKPRDLRRHPSEIRYTLLAALCWQRQREITDSLVDLLLHIVHRIGVRAEAKVDVALMQYAKKVVGKSKLLYKLAKAAKRQPDGRVKDVIYPAVREQTLDEIIRETEAEGDTSYRSKSSPGAPTATTTVASSLRCWPCWCSNATVSGTDR